MQVISSLVLVCFLFQNTFAYNSFGTTIPKYGTECFYEYLSFGSRLDFSYEVMSYFESDMDFYASFIIKYLLLLIMNIDYESRWNHVTYNKRRTCV